MYLSTALDKKKSLVKDIAVYSDRDAAMINYELPAELYEFHNLEQLYLSCHFKNLSDKIAQLDKLTRLSLSSNRLTKLPKEIGQLSNLEHLSIQAPIDQIPIEIGQLKKLKSLYISHTSIKTLPPFLAQLSFLERLVISKNSSLKDISAIGACRQPTLTNLSINNELYPKQLLPIFKVTSLTSLWINNNNLDELPTEINQLTSLQTLNLGNNQLKNLPEALLPLKQLTDIRFHLNQIEQFPTVLLQMPQLQKIIWTDNPLGTSCQEILQLPLSVINPYSNVVPRRKFEKFITTIKAQNFSSIQLDLFFNIQNTRPLPLATYQRHDFIRLTNFPDKTFVLSVVEKMLLYKQNYLEEQPLSKESSLCILGKVSLSKNNIKATLKKQGITYQTSINGKTTHVLVGTSIKDYSILNTYPKTTLISEQIFQQYMNDWTDPYLLQKESVHSLQNIAALLLSQDTNNQALGIELLKGGGVPATLLTELFIVYKFCTDKKVAQKARNLVKRNASASLLDKLKLRIPLGSIKDSYLTNGKIQQLTEGTELIPWKIAQYAYRFNQSVWKNAAPLGLQDAPTAEAKSFLHQVVLDEAKRFDNMGRFTLRANWIPFSDLLFDPQHPIKELWVEKVSLSNLVTQLKELRSIVLYGQTNNDQLPASLKKASMLETIYFFACEYQDWSSIMELVRPVSTLKTLRFSSSSLSNLPQNITTLTNITHIELSTCCDAENLKKLAQIPQLRSLYCSNPSCDLDDAFLVLHNIQELNFERDNKSAYQVTPNIAQLKNLKALKLKGPAQIPDEINDLISLESLHIHFTYHRPQPLQAHQIDRLQNLHTLRINGELEGYEQVLPLFKKLEFLELYYGKYSNEVLLDLLGKIPSLKTFRRFLNPQDLALFQRKYPHINFISK
jgi:Leucine-rich repeat (LRR) protein